MASWKRGDKAIVRVPSPLPEFTAHWDDWRDSVSNVHLEEVVLGEPAWHETTFGYYVSWPGGEGVWVPKAWLGRSPYVGGAYCCLCGGLGTHKLGCPTLKPYLPEDQ